MPNSQTLKLQKGVFCISIDTEMLWGRHDLFYQPFIERTNKERQVIKDLLNLFEKYQISATWAIVGHLFLNECSPKSGKIHPEINRPNFPWISGDWLKHDPKTNINKAPQWYGKDIVQLLKSHHSQEIGSHSFSHMIFGNKGCSYKCAESEIRTCVKLANENKIKLESFVFPRNSIGHLGILNKYHFKSYRGPDSYPFKTNNPLGKLLMLIDLLLLIPHTSNPQINNNLLEIPGNMYFLSTRGRRKFLPRKIRSLKAKSSLKQASKNNKVFHLWFHPTDLVDNPSLLLNQLEEVILYAKKLEAAGKIEIKNMSQIYNTLQSANQIQAHLP